MANTKITKREVIINMLKEEVIKSNESYTNFLTHELELMDRKNESRKTSEKAIAKAEEIAKIKNAILEILAKTDNELSASAIRDKIGTEYSVPKITSILTKLKIDGLIIREQRGRYSYYHLS